MSDYPTENELAFMLVIPHNHRGTAKSIRVYLVKSFLKPGVFHLQQIQPLSLNRLETKLGALTSNGIRSWQTVGDITQTRFVNATPFLIRIRVESV